MVDAITAISASSETSATRVESSLSITSEPDNKWTAERQSKIDADQVALKGAHNRRERPSDQQDEMQEAPIPLFEGHSRKRKSDRPREHFGLPEGETEDAGLSGESELIGTTNFDDDTPFGERVAIV